MCGQAAKYTSMIKSIHGKTVFKTIVCDLPDITVFGQPSPVILVQVVFRTRWDYSGTSSCEIPSHYFSTLYYITIVLKLPSLLRTFF